jgi:mono/diheme cytochrome c family protein
VIRLVPLLAAMLAFAGCGGSDSGGGKPADQFVSLGCASCHTLKAANAHGTVGPNLDEVKPSVAEVEQKVRNGGGGMPSFSSKLDPDEIHAIAEYVAGAAGG